MIPEGLHVIVIIINKKISDPSGGVHEMVIKKNIQSDKKINVYDPAGVDVQLRISIGYKHVIPLGSLFSIIWSNTHIITFQDKKEKPLIESSCYLILNLLKQKSNGNHHT